MSTRVIAIVLIGAGFLFAGDKQSNDAGIPAGAVKVDATTSKYTDAAGKKWIYKATPFGIAKYEDKESAADATATAPAPKNQAGQKTPFGPYDSSVSARDTSVRMTKAHEEKGTVYFERPGPFGMIRWSRAKNDLTDEEKAIWEAQKSAGSQGTRN